MILHLVLFEHLSVKPHLIKHGSSLCYTQAPDKAPRIACCLTLFFKISHDPQNVKPLSKWAFCQRTMAHHDGAGEFAVEIIPITIGFVLSKGFDLLIHIFFSDFHQEMGEESVGRTHHIEPEDCDPSKSAERLVCHCIVILMNILFRVSKDQIGLKILAESQEIFKNILS